MKSKILCFISIFIMLCSTQDGNAQGCSDAGFCTTGNLRPLASDSLAVKNQQLSLIIANGIGDEGVYVLTPALQYENRLNKSWSLQAKLTSNYASGNLGTAFGLGDVILSTTYTKKAKNNWEGSFLLGTKLPLNLSDLSIDNKPLPMQYQSSLGTVDLIAGMSFTNGKWFLATAVQQPLTGTNRNTFLPAYWNTNEALEYPSTNDFDRRGDVLLRVGYDVRKSERMKINLGLLSIYHLGKDTYIDGNISNRPIKIDGSEGLTLNGTFAFRYKAGEKFDIGLSGGAPFIVRDVRPDGLTRAFVLSPEFTFKF